MNKKDHRPITHNQFARFIKQAASAKVGNIGKDHNPTKEELTRKWFFDRKAKRFKPVD